MVLQRDRGVAPEAGPLGSPLLAGVVGMVPNACGVRESGIILPTNPVGLKACTA